MNFGKAINQSITIEPSANNGFFVKICIKEETLSAILNNHCSCGGRGPQDDPCSACAIWHEIIACQEEGENMAKIDDNKLVEVCDKCLTASCWYGEFMCSEAQGAGTIKKTVRELRKLNLEHEDNWSDEKMKAIYGEPVPFKGEKHCQPEVGSCRGRYTILKEETQKK